MRLLVSCFPAPGSEEIPRIPLLLAPPWSWFNCSQEQRFVLFRLLSNRIDNTNSQLLRRHWELVDRVNCLEQEFCICKISIEVNGTFAFPLLQDSTTQSTGAFEDKMTNLFESLYTSVGGAIPLFLLDRGNRHTASHPTLDPRTSSVPAWTSWRKSWPLRHSKYNSHHSFSVDVVKHWHENDPVLEVFGLDVLLSPSRSGSREE